MKLSPRRMMSYPLGVTAGGLLYAGLVWLPVLGPVLAGFAAGALAGGGVRRGFSAGVASGLVGLCLIILMASSLNLSGLSGLGLLALILVSWVMLLWNLVGILLAGAGGVAGVFYRSLNTAISPLFQRIKARSSDGVEYRICSVCGVGNLTANPQCVECRRVFNEV